MHRYNPRQRQQWDDCFSDSDEQVDDLDQCLRNPHKDLDPQPQNIQAQTSLIEGWRRNKANEKDKSYMALQRSYPVTEGANGPLCLNDDEGNNTSTNAKDNGVISLSTLFDSVGDPDSLLQRGSAYLLQCLSSSQRLFWFFLIILASFLVYPLTSTIIFGGIIMVLVAGHQNDHQKTRSRSAKWTIIGFTHQLKDGFLASPAFLDKCGQWRMVVKQKKGMDGPQTSFGLMCTDIVRGVESVSTNVTFFCTDRFGQEVSTGGMRNLRFQHDFERPGDCGMSRSIRISRRQLGDNETIIVHCNIEFKTKTLTFLKNLALNLQNNSRDDGDRIIRKKGTNIVTEHGSVFPGDLEFHEESSLPPSFRPVMRFVQHPETRTFIWEIPAFTSLMENSELWGVYSPQFFVNSHDICSVWRMKLLEVEGVFRLHVQLRGLPRTVKQVKLWYLLQLVDMYGDSVIPEHAVCRVKYPDHMNLWDTTRHILYRRETMLERFIGSNGELCLRISLQMEPNNLALMEIDSDEWIHRPLNSTTQGISDAPENVRAAEARGLLYEIEQARSNMLSG